MAKLIEAITNLVKGETKPVEQPQMAPPRCKPFFFLPESDNLQWTGGKDTLTHLDDDKPLGGLF